MSQFDVDEFARSLGLQESNRRAVVETLTRFPKVCKSRGMFANGVLESVARVHGDERRDQIRENAGYPRRISSFGLYPHSDFYRVFYASAAALHPDKPLGKGMRLVAEEFYPIFIQSLAGRTMHALIGRTPDVVLGRFVEAYKIATPWNEHRIVDSARDCLVWNCMVEPCPHYPDTFAGICTGMVRTVTGITPQFEIQQHTVGSNYQNFSFGTSW